MPVTNVQSGTNVHEIAAGIFRISTPVPPEVIPGGFTFNQFLVVDDEPLLFHCGLRRMFPLVREAVTHVLGDPGKLRWLAFSHVEADECGSLNDWLALAPQASPVCSITAALVSVNDIADRPARPLGDSEEMAIGGKRVRWLDAPHVPHNWECGYLFETTTRTLLCGDVFTHLGNAIPALTEGDILEPTLAAHAAGMSGMGVGQGTRGVLEKLARTEPATLGLMHGSSYRGDGGRLLRDLVTALGV
jgi:glyoxylase-like metal-dependent hydrolase (beta-lactamase superfamily II)